MPRRRPSVVLPLALLLAPVPEPMAVDGSIVLRTTVEGARITTYSRVVGRGSVEVLIHTEGDEYGAETVVRYRCTGLRATGCRAP